MSSVQCFICHGTVNSITNGVVRERYREVNGINLCPDAHLCYICCHMVNKLWLFKALCVKRSLQYPVLFSDTGAINLQRTYTEFHTLCSKAECHNQSEILNSTLQNIYCGNECTNGIHNKYDNTNIKYIEELHNESNNFDDYINITGTSAEDFRNEIAMGHINDVEDIKSDNYNNTYDITEDNDYESSIDNENDEDVLLKDVIDTDRDNREKKKKSKKHKKCELKEKLLTVEEQKIELELKRKEKKYLEAEFKCYNCALGFLFKDTYQTHMMRHEESNGEYRCEVCTLRFAAQSILRSHQAVHARGFSARPTRTVTEENTPCHLCGRVFKDASGLQQHLKRFHHSNASNRTYSCSVCGKVYNNKAAVRTHLIKHINRKFTCEQCSSTFSSPYTLNQHKKRHELTTQDQHHCEICNLTYNSRKSLLAHKRNALVHQNTIYKCQICNRICPNQRALSSHIATVHSTSKDYSCHLCRAQYTSRKSLVRHISSHTKPQTKDVHVCHRCPSTFTSQSKLNRHLREVCEKDRLVEELFP